MPHGFRAATGAGASLDNRVITRALFLSQLQLQGINVALFASSLSASCVPMPNHASTGYWSLALLYSLVAATMSKGKRSCFSDPASGVAEAPATTGWTTTAHSTCGVPNRLAALLGRIPATNLGHNATRKAVFRALVMPSDRLAVAIPLSLDLSPKTFAAFANELDLGLNVELVVHAFCHSVTSSFAAGNAMTLSGPSLDASLFPMAPSLGDVH